MTLLKDFRYKTSMNFMETAELKQIGKHLCRLNIPSPGEVPPPGCYLTWGWKCVKCNGGWSYGAEHIIEGAPCKMPEINLTNKSVLDNTPVKEVGFNYPAKELGKLGQTKEHTISHLTLDIVGHCTSCGSPIYGTHRVLAGEKMVVQRSCACSSNKTLSDTMYTK